MDSFRFRSRSVMSKLRLQLFGGIRAEIERDGEFHPAHVEPKRLALLAYLAADVAGHLHTRDSILSLFWPERPEPLARLALRQSLHHLATRLGPELIARDGHQLVGLAMDRVSCDVHRFERALEEQRLRDALEEYRGDFLEGFVLSRQPEPFEDWIRRTRLRLRDAAVAAVLAVAGEEGMAAAGAHPALAWVHRALSLSPYSEDLLNQAVELRLRSGDRGGALGEVRDFSRRLQSEMGIEPSRRVESLRARVSSRDDRRPTNVSSGIPIRLPADGLRHEVEAVLGGRADRTERTVRCEGPGGEQVVCRWIVEPVTRDGIVSGATIRFASPDDQVTR